MYLFNHSFINLLFQLFTNILLSRFIQDIHAPFTSFSKKFTFSFTYMCYSNGQSIWLSFINKETYPVVWKSLFNIPIDITI